MRVINIIAEDFTNYRKPAMFIGTPYCDGKCNKEYGNVVCQNEDLKDVETLSIDAETIVKMYLHDDISKAIVIGGREPFDDRTFPDIIYLLEELRFNYNCDDDVVIYTGFYPDEISDKLSCLNKFSNIIVKFGRYIPNQKRHRDELLGVELASDNQFAKEIY